MTAPLTAPRRVVIVGNGMAGARLAEELDALDPHGRRVHVTVLGDEPHAAYNRVLLSTLLAGGIGEDQTRLRTRPWSPSSPVRVRTAAPVAAVDTAARRVILAGGAGSVAYDDLVLATGGAPRTPAIAGAYRDDGAPAEGVAAFRTLDDCRAIAGAARAGTRVTVVGAGLLGLEAARGVLQRGASVTLVHPGGHPMDRELDADGGTVLARTFRALGAEVVTGRRARALHGPGHDGEGTGRALELDEGTLIPTDLLILSAGTAPRTGLAAAAGIAVDDGILVDDALRTSDPHVRAIGDCCEHRGTVYGLVQPAWEQAAVLARLLTGDDARYTGSARMTRLKAHGVDLVAMGRVDVDPHDERHEVLTLADPSRGRYAKAVLRGGRLIGAVALGNPGVAGTFAQFFDSRAPVPSDRMALLVGRTAVADAAPANGSDVVCRCNTVTVDRLEEAWNAGARTVDNLARDTRAGTGCGGCRGDLAALCARWSGAAGADVEGGTPMEKGDAA